MFDVYMQEQTLDPRVRNRLMMSALAGMAVTTGAIALLWTANQFSISQVNAPQVAEQLMLTLSTDPPPPAPPPARPRAAAAGSKQDQSTSRAPEEPTEPTIPQDDLQPSNPEPVRGTGDGTGARASGVPGNKGVPGPPGNCIGPLCGAGPNIPGIGTVPRTPPSVPDKVMEPIGSIKARALFSPDPDVAALAKTSTGMMTQRSGRVSVAFCVGPSGKVDSAKIVKSFGHDPAVDSLCRNAVKRWRFKPAKVAGKLRTTCSEVTFDLRFEQ